MDKLIGNVKLADLRALIQGISSWPELEGRIGDLPSEMARGEAFESFCYAFLFLDPLFQFDKVYRHKEIPPSLRERLGYPGIQDLGIDGLAVTTDGKLFAYQAKFRKDRSKVPSLRELSTFFTVSDRADWRLTITNANGLPPSINDRMRQSRILADRFDQLDSEFFDRLRIYCQEQAIRPPVRKEPHLTQQEAITEALTYFAHHDRGQLILPCGTGKTLAAMWIAERLGGNRILVMVPSLSLLSQTLREWAAHTSIRPFRYLCLCSDTTVDLGQDSPVEHIYEMDVPVTTDPGDVSAFLSAKPSATSIIFSTYQSSRVLSEATKTTGTTFDIAVFDEAHRTTGPDASLWSIALDDKRVPVNRRLFITATPRIYAPHITKKAKENDVLLCSMDDTALYGKPFYEMTFGKAIERGHITDFKVVVIFTTDTEVKNMIERSGRIVSDEHEWDAKAFAKRIALIKGINAYGLKKVFTFHGSVRGAKSFTDKTTPYGIDHIIKMLGTPNLTHDAIKYFHVNGTMPAGHRAGLMKEFREASMGIMSNARCLTEGIDIPAVDTVAFIDPKRSLIDIVQATGRALRKAEWKERGYIFIPVVIDESLEPEDIIDVSDFDTVWKVLQAMVDQDQRLESIISTLRTLQGQGEEETQAWKDAMTEFSEKIEFYDLPKKIDKIRFVNNLYVKTFDIIGKKWDFWYGLTLKYKERFGDPNAPARYRTPDGYRLGTWQSNLRQRYIQGILSPDRVQRFEEIGFTWSIPDETFEKGFRETLRYREQTGNANAPNKYHTPDGYKLGSWQQNQRSLFAKRKVSQDRVQRLEEIGFKWSIFDDAFEKGFQETLKYREQFGDPNAPNNYLTSDGYKLGSWQNSQRSRFARGKVPQNRVQRLEEMGFTWSILDETFEKGFRETLRYREQTGNANAPNKYRTPEGYKLGEWLRAKRVQYAEGLLSTDKVQRLEEIGFSWNIFDRDFEQGFQETLRYRVQFGDPNAPKRYRTPDGFRLGAWQRNKRTFYVQGKLPQDRVSRLEEIGLSWNLYDEAFEKGYRETLRYKEQFGFPNVPYKYTTPEGYRLGNWQGSMRQNYAQGKLSPDRVHKLDDIGFTWSILDETFEKGFRETLRYKEQFGVPNVPYKYTTPEGYRLGNWQGSMRQNYAQGKLSPDRVHKLDDIGFTWSMLDEAFEKGFRETLRYKEQFGVPNAPAKYQTPEGYLLSTWQAYVRQRYAQGKLTPDRVSRLEASGFKWSLK